MKRISLHLFAFFALTISSLFPLEIDAIGQVTEPIEIKNALWKTPYNETMTIMNTERSTVKIKLSAEGDIAEWVRFFQDAAAMDDITEISIRPGEKSEFLARFIVPEGIPNGIYKGHVNVLKMPADAGANSSTQKINREVSIQVSDVEKINFDSSVIPEEQEISSGDILRIRVIHDNRSNVAISPRVAIQIKQEDNVIYNAIFPYPDNHPKVGPGLFYEIPTLEIPTSNLGTGRYEASLAISQGDFSVKKDFDFTIGTVMAATTAAPVSPPATSPDLSRWTIILATGFLLFVVLRFRSHRTRRFDGRVSIDNFLQE